MMSTNSVINRWVESCFYGNKSCLLNSNSVFARGNKLYSYNTVIAFCDIDGRFHLNTKKYSVTTSKHQTFVRRAFSEFGITPIEQN